jgi:hypothetical protein
MEGLTSARRACETIAEEREENELLELNENDRSTGRNLVSSDDIDDIVNVLLP